MDSYQLAVIAIALLNAVAIPVVKNLFGRLDRQSEKHEMLSAALQQYQLHVAETYVNHDHLDRQMDAVNKNLDEIKLMISELRQKVDDVGRGE